MCEHDISRHACLHLLDQRAAEAPHERVERVSRIALVKLCLEPPVLFHRVAGRVCFHRSRSIDPSNTRGSADAGTTRGSVEPLPRLTELADAAVIGQLLHDFNSEFGDPTPGADRLAVRIRSLLAEEQVTVLLAGAGPDGLAVLRFRPAIRSEALECYLAELYVVPNLRGRGLGRALTQAAIAHARSRGADRMDLGAGERDLVARVLYESLGFDNRAGRPDGPVNHFYEREL